MVADSSDAAYSDRVFGACAQFATYQRFDPDLLMADKLVRAVQSVKTPFVVITPDDDVTLPHAINESLSFLQRHDDHVAAQGYILDFQLNEDAFDIYRVFGFTPTIGERDPLQRLYHLMRRYQPFYFAVIRTEVLLQALQAAVSMRMIAFRELTVMSCIVLQGKVARLPIVYNLRGSEQSLTASTQSHPFFAFLDSAEGFLLSYAKYRNGLARIIRESSIGVPDNVKLEQLLDVIHATYFAREMDTGILNYTAQLMLGDDLPPVSIARPSPSQGPSDADVTRRSASGARLYIWREQVIKAEPRYEISITADEMQQVEQQLDDYQLDSSIT
jgi:glycosyltransferase domain-containing protein